MVANGDSDPVFQYLIRDVSVQECVCGAEEPVSQPFVGSSTTRF